MAIVVMTTDPAALLEELRGAVRTEIVKSWTCDADGDFSLPELMPRAWLRPEILTDRIIFKIFPARNGVVTRRTYAQYHSRLIDVLLGHFDLKFSSAYATAMPTYGDRVKDSE